MTIEIDGKFYLIRGKNITSNTDREFIGYYKGFSILVEWDSFSSLHLQDSWIVFVNKPSVQFGVIMDGVFYGTKEEVIKEVIKNIIS